MFSNNHETTRNLKTLRQRTINLCTSLLMIHYFTLSLFYNSWLKRLDTQLIEPTNQNLVKVPKIVKPTNKLKLWGLV